MSGAQRSGSADGQTVQPQQSERQQLQRETNQKTEGSYNGLGCFPGAGQPLHRVGESRR